MTARTIRADIDALRQFGPDIHPVGEGLDQALAALADARYRLVSGNSYGLGRLPDLDVEAMAMRLHTAALAEGFAGTANRLELAAAGGAGVGGSWRNGARTMVPPPAVADAERFRSGRTADRGDAVVVVEETTDEFTLEVAVALGTEVGVTVVRQVFSDGRVRLVVRSSNGITAEASVGPPSITAGGGRGGAKIGGEAKAGIGVTLEQGTVYEFRDEGELERFWRRDGFAVVVAAAATTAATNAPGGSLIAGAVRFVRRLFTDDAASGTVSAGAARAEAGVEAGAETKVALGTGGSSVRGPLKTEARAGGSFEARSETTKLAGGVTEQRVTVEGKLEAAIESKLPLGDLPADRSSSTSPTMTATLVHGPDGPIELRLSTTTGEPPAWLGHTPPGEDLSFRTDVVIDLSNRVTAALVARHYGRPIEQLDPGTLGALLSTPLVGELAARSEIVVSAQRSTGGSSHELAAGLGAGAAVAVSAKATSTTTTTVAEYRKREGEQSFRREGGS